MMRLSEKVRRYCKAHRIRPEQESEQYTEFTAPAGYVFGNQSRRRILDMLRLTEAEVIGALHLFQEVR